MTIKSAPPRVTEPFYFGCYEETGHNTFTRDMRTAGRCAAAQWLSNHDGQLPPQEDRETQGIVQFRSWPGACVVAFWDCSVDSRGNSSSSFLLPGEWPPDLALAIARTVFPKIFERFTFEVVLK